MKVMIEIETQNLSLEAKRLIARECSSAELLKALSFEESEIEVKAYLSMNPATPKDAKEKLKNKS